MIGIYLSGTGNTEHCVRKLVRLLDESAQAIPMEKKETVYLLSQHDFIVFAYPVQFSNVPVMVKDFIKSHPDLWKGKKILCVATMGLFSGDGAGCSARLLKKYGAEIVGGFHIRMPDSVCDVKLLKKSFQENREIIRKADRKIEKCAEEIRKGRYPKNGLHLYSRIAGLLCQRLWYYSKTKSYSDQLKISNACTGCGLCTRLCPADNLRNCRKMEKPPENTVRCVTGASVSVRQGRSRYWDTQSLSSAAMINIAKAEKSEII